MPDSTDPDETGPTPPGSGARRAGLDRLRAARVGADPGAAPSPADRTAADRPASPGRTGGGDRGAGSTALLDTGAEADDVAGGETEPDETTSGVTRARSAADTAGDEVPTATRRGRLRRRKATGVAADAASARPTKSAIGRPAGVGTPSVHRAQVIAVVVLGLIVIGLAVPVFIMRHRIVGQTSDQKAVSKLVDKKTQATGAALRFSATFFTSNYKTVDQYSDQVVALSTGEFLSDFNSKRAQVKSLTTQAQSVATGKVLSSGVSKVSGNTVEVLVVVDQDIQNNTSKGKTVTQRYRVRITEQLMPKGWLVSKLEPL
jgi:hypothetical protein